MSKSNNVLEMERQNGRYKDRIIIALIIMITLMMIAYFRIPTKFTVYQPPVLDQTYVSKAGSIPPTTVYSFASLILDRVMRCETDCEVNIPSNLEANRTFITESCYHSLLTHAERNTQLYRGRTRMLSPVDSTVFSFDKVKILNAKTWVIQEDYNLESKVRGQTLRNETYHYEMKIVKSSQHIEVNPYQLQFDCFAVDPILLEN